MRGRGRRGDRRRTRARRPRPRSGSMPAARARAIVTAALPGTPNAGSNERRVRERERARPAVARRDERERVGGRDEPVEAVGRHERAVGHHDERRRRARAGPRAPARARARARRRRRGASRARGRAPDPASRRGSSPPSDASSHAARTASSIRTTSSRSPVRAEGRREPRLRALEALDGDDGEHRVSIRGPPTVARATAGARPRGRADGRAAPCGIGPPWPTPSASGSVSASRRSVAWWRAVVQVERAASPARARPARSRPSRPR